MNRLPVYTQKLAMRNKITVNNNQHQPQ